MISRDGCTLSMAAALLLPNFGKVGRTLASHVARQNDAALLTTVINPNGYDDWQEFFRDYQAISLLSKYPQLRVTVDKRAVALDSFRVSELECGRVNQMFCRHLASFRADTIECLYKARDFVARVLGEFSWDTAAQYCRFGPGSSVGLPRSRSHPCQKIGNLQPTITGQCLPLFEAYRKYDRHFNDIGMTPVIVLGSKGITVPKNAKTDRFIAIEPQLNMFFQKGIGAMIRSRLAAWGLDLDTQQTRNQEFALRGSLTNSLATIDLSRASDSVSSALAEFLLPEKWCDAMKTVRSPYCDVDGESLFLRKFSSMGNGFTFELQSLFFLALTWSVTHLRGENVRDVACYGDDIICPSACALPLLHVLKDIGFDSNVKKSFWDGPFRESCGKHYFRGHDVTPFFLKKVLTTTHDILWAVNSLRRAASRMGNHVYCSSRYFEGYSYLLKCLPARIRALSVPDGYGDDAVLRDFDEATPKPKRLRNWVEGFEGKAFVESRPTVEFEDLPALVQFFWANRLPRRQRTLEPGEVDAYSRFGSTSGLRRRVVTREYTQWPSIGPWH